MCPQSIVLCDYITGIVIIVVMFLLIYSYIELFATDIQHIVYSIYKFGKLNRAQK